jgi:hypothetical protein
MSPDAPRPAAAPRRGPPWAQALIGVLLVGFGMEAGLWALHGGAQAPLPIYAEGGAAGVALLPGARAAGLIRGRHRYTVAVAADGCRSPVPAAPAGALVGDSLAFGLGVEGEGTAAALAAPPWLNGGVPGFGALDAALRGGELAARLPAGAPLWLLFNPVDEGAPGEGRLAARASVAGGYLLPRGAPGVARAFFRSPAARSRLLVALWGLGGGLARAGRPDEGLLWLGDPAEVEPAFAAIGAALRAALDPLRGRPIRVLWGSHPLQTLGDGAPGGALEPIGAGRGAAGRARAAAGLGAAQAGLARGLGEGLLLDLGPILAGCGPCYLPGDLHWSAEGHARVAAVLGTASAPKLPPDPPVPLLPDPPTEDPP